MTARITILGAGKFPNVYACGDIANTGTCYNEFGAGRIGRVDVDFFSGPKPTGQYHEPSAALRADRNHFGSSRRARWFGL